ncbi:MAG TPA: hypothetical protein VJJ55_00925 [Candidatus Paceibacterota bacterium]
MRVRCPPPAPTRQGDPPDCFASRSGRESGKQNRSIFLIPNKLLLVL